MIIICPSCEKRFEVSDNLIPDTGRTLKCGFCDQTWFFNKKDKKKIKISEKTELKSLEDSINSIENTESYQISSNTTKKRKIKNEEKKGSEIVEYQHISNFTFGKFLSYLIVLIISLIAGIIVLDTFKNPLYNLFPNLEFVIFSLYETLKDIQLFIKDLI